MKVVIPGGTGQVGGILRRALREWGHEVVVPSRHPGTLEPGVRHVAWDGRTLGGRADDGADADAVVTVRIARNWEAAQPEAVVPHTPRVALRAAMVMSPDRRGVFDVLLAWPGWGSVARSPAAAGTCPGSTTTTSSTPSSSCWTATNDRGSPAAPGVTRLAGQQFRRRCMIGV